MPLLLEWGEEIDLCYECVAETVFLILLSTSNNVFFVVVMILQIRQAMVTYFGCCCYSGGPPYSLDCWSACNIWGKMGARGWKQIVVSL